MGETGVAAADKVDPIHQFIVSDIFTLFHVGGAKVAFQVPALFMLIVVALILGLMSWSIARRSIVPGRLQSAMEIFYEYVENLVTGILGHDGKAFFPFVFAIFSFILTANVIGLVPYFYTVTSQIIVTASLAVMVFVIVIVVGFYKNGLGFLGLFVPHGLPILIVPVIAVIEVISFFARPVSHSLRLFGNMLAGHIVLKVFAGFIISLSAFGVVGMVGAVAPFLMVVAIYALEVLVAALQALVFSVLTCIYLKDALHPQH